MRTQHAASRINTFRLRAVGGIISPDCSQCEREGLYARTTGCVGNRRSGFSGMGRVFSDAQDDCCHRKRCDRRLWGHGWKRLSGQAVCPQGLSGAGYCICDLRRIGALRGWKDIHDTRFHHGKAVFPASRIPCRAQTGSDPPRRCAHEFCDGKTARKGKIMMNIPVASSRTSSLRRISRSVTTPIMTMRSIRRGLSGTMCCSTTRSSAIIL